MTPKQRIARRDGIRDAASGPLPQQHDRRPRRLEQLAFQRRNLANRLHVRQIPQHDGEGLLVAVLSPPQFRHGGLAGRIADQVVSADAFHRPDAARANGLRRTPPADRRPQSAAPSSSRSRSAGPQSPAAGRLGMEPPIGRVLVFLAGTPAHREAGHRGPRTVVGAAGDDRQPRPAVRAIQERIAIAAVGRVEQLGEAGGTRCHVGRNQHLAVARRLSLASMRNCASPRGETGDQETRSMWASGGGWCVSSSRKRSRDPRSPSTSIRTLPVWFLTNPCKLQTRGQPVNERPEADALDDAVHADRSTLHHHPPPHSQAMRETRLKRERWHPSPSYSRSDVYNRQACDK